MNTFFYRVLPIILNIGLVPIALCSSASGEDWSLQIDDRKNDITLHYRKAPNGLTEFRGITHIVSSLSAFVALFRDVDAMPKWVDHANTAVNLKQISDTEVYAHIVATMPFPFTDRHSIVHSNITQDPISGEIVISGQDAEPEFLQYLSAEKREYLAQQKKYVLIRDLKSHWVFRPQLDGLVEVEFQGHGNPGGNLSDLIPQWLLRMFIWEAPYNTLKNLREIVLDSKYQHRRFSFIQEIQN